VSPTPSSTASESQPHTPAVSGLDAFSWPTHSHYEENRLLLGTEEESSERQTSDEDEALAVSDGFCGCCTSTYICHLKFLPQMVRVQYDRWLLIYASMHRSVYSSTWSENQIFLLSLLKNNIVPAHFMQISRYFSHPFFAIFLGDILVLKRHMPPEKLIFSLTQDFHFLSWCTLLPLLDKFGFILHFYFHFPFIFPLASFLFLVFFVFSSLHIFVLSALDEIFLVGRGRGYFLFIYTPLPESCILLAVTVTASIFVLASLAPLIDELVFYVVFYICSFLLS
jgi:hypothetical protein